MKSKRKETTLLDSSLNTGHVLCQTPYLPNFLTYLNYNIKVVDCKGYKQLYLYENVKSHKISGLDKDIKKEFIFEDLISKEKYDSNYISNEKEVDFKNVMRSKFKLQRIVKANEQDWKTFITITFKENITDLSVAYSKFRAFIKVIGRHKKDFKWVSVPEFQKSGKVHYHLVTNIDINDTDLVYTQTLEDGQITYHLKHWSKSINKYTNLPNGKGYDCIEEVKDKDGNDTKKLCGYISKYMSKAYIEDCFFNKNRYYLSQNLILPKESYLDTTKKEDYDVLNNLLSSTDLLYTREYNDTFGNNITFIELKIKSNI